MTDDPAFMSAEHLAAMNARLAQAPDVLAAASELGSDRVLVHRLANGPGGRPEYWTMVLGPSGVRFAAEPPDRVDVTIHSDWHERMLSLHAAKAGRSVECPERVEGDPAVLERVLTVVAMGQRVATVPARLPEVDP